MTIFNHFRDRAARVAPYNKNDKTYFEPLLERERYLEVSLRLTLIKAQYSSVNVREAI